MPSLARIIAVSLLVAIAVASPGTHALAFSSTQPGHPAGCHGARSTTPAKAPVSYQCCSNGHHWAILSAAFSPCPPAALCMFQNAADEPFTNFTGPHLHPAVFSFGSPPTNAPLRI